MTTFPVGSRYFNRLTYDPERHAVTKRSANEPKLRNEIHWYLSVPESLRPYMPEVYDYSLEPGNVFITLEYVQLPSLSALLVSASERSAGWTGIFCGLEEVLGRMASLSGRVKASCVESMYIQKTRLRLNQFLEQSGFAKDAWRKGHYRLNGKAVLCPVAIFEHHQKEFRELLASSVVSVIHGDFCLSNLFYGEAGSRILMIDPRGSFGERGIYGDNRYDLAKVRHSFSGYEHVVSDVFELRAATGELEVNVPLRPVHRLLRSEWDAGLGASARQVKLIESLLFLSMLPLHRDRPDRQLALYGIGTQLLYEALEDE